MNLTTILQTTSLALALSVPAATQEVAVTGVVKPIGAPVCAGATHELECTDVTLASAVIDLDALIGQNVRLTGKLTGAPCATLDVGASEPPVATLISCGNPVPGCGMRFRVGPSGVIGQYWLFYSPFSDVVPLSPQKGTLLLGNPFFLLASGLTFGDEAAVDIVLPSDTSLTGVEVFLQGARRDVGPVGPIQFSNAICFTILGPSPPCVSTDC